MQWARSPGIPETGRAEAGFHVNAEPIPPIISLMARESKQTASLVAWAAAMFCLQAALAGTAGAETSRARLAVTATVLPSCSTGVSSDPTSGTSPVHARCSAGTTWSVTSSQEPKAPTTAGSASSSVLVTTLTF